METLIGCGAILFSIALIIVLGLMSKEDNVSRNIAVYSGSFDPLHIGHKAILEEISNKYDWVYLIVTPQNPLKENKSTLVDERVKKAHDALLRNEMLNVTINNIEQEMLPPYYTIRTLDELKRRNPQDNYTLIIGADNLVSIKEWNNYERILVEYGVLVFSRGDYDVSTLENIKNELLKNNSKYKIEINKTLIPNISSTEIRDAMKQGNNVTKFLM